MVRPLEGVRVVEFTNAVAGPVAGLVLADLGAQVIKIEGPSRGIPSVVAPAAAGAPDRPYNRVPLFNELNRGKLSLPLDLTRPEARSLFYQLVQRSDIVIQNYSTPALRALQFDYPHLRRVKENIVVVCIPAFGTWGPWQDRRAYGPGVDAVSGLCYLTGYGDGRPMKPGNFFCDYNAGLLAALAAIAALRQLRSTGQGAYIECALLDSELPLLGEAFMEVVFNGRVPEAMGNRHPAMAPHGVYRCRGDDRWLAIACPNDEAFEALARAIGKPELAEDVRFRSLLARLCNQDELDAIINEWASGQDSKDAAAHLQRAGVPAMPVLDSGDLADDPHYRRRGFFVRVSHPEMGVTPVPRLAFRYQWLESLPRRGAPCFGEHTDYVLKEVLGLDRHEIERLVRSGVVFRDPTPDPVGRE
jgi:crotonobetainyl-CoA:carnitine CoA-transferase CaiB-like acyl-CoA transferase